jgi:hypothetical protein
MQNGAGIAQEFKELDNVVVIDVPHIPKGEQT